MHNFSKIGQLVFELSFSPLQKKMVLRKTRLQYGKDVYVKNRVFDPADTESSIPVGIDSAENFTSILCLLNIFFFLPALI